MNAARGVSLLEALVALTIIGSAFGAILSLQSQLMLSLSSIERSQLRATWLGNINEIANSLDYKTFPSGRLEMGRNLEVRWEAVKGEGWQRPNRTAFRQAGDWKVRLTPVDFEVRNGAEVVLRQRRLVVTAEPPERTEGQRPGMFGGPLAGTQPPQP